MTTARKPEVLVIERGNESRMTDRRSFIAAGLRRLAVRRPVAFVSTAILALALIAGGITVVKFADRSIAEADARLEHHAEALSADLGNLFLDASRDLRLARLNSTFDGALASAGITAREQGLIEGAITYVGERYHVDEICLIRPNGAETARWNGGTVAPLGSLSADESGNPFFKPAMSLGDDAVFVTQPYVSPDSHRWVYGFATPIVLATGVRAGVLHFEIPIQRLVDLVTSDPFDDGGSTMVVDRAGRMLVDPAAPLSMAATVDANASLPLIASTQSSGLRDVLAAAIADPAGSAMVSFDDARGAQRVAYRSVPGTDLVVLSVSPFASLYADVARTRLNLVVTVGPLILLIVLVTIWFGNRLSRTNRRLAAASRASSELASIVHSADDAILSVEPDGRVATWNAGAEAMYGLVEREAVGERLDILFAPNQGEEVPRLLEAVMAGAAVERHDAVHRRADGSLLTVSMTVSPISDDSGVVIGASVIARDVSDRKQLEEELARQALHDSLTGLPNRVLFHDRLRQSLHRVRRQAPATGRHAVLFVDLDDFKRINDTLGHRIGDELLVAVAARLRDAIRSVDTAARLGGDEFTVLLENVGDEADADRAADRILDELRRPFELDGHQIVVSASIGIAFGDAGTDDPDDLLRCADTALYEAKARGKGRHETYHSTMNVRAWHRLELEGELRLAIVRGELRVHYQPIVELDGGRIVEIEALVRWQHPTRGLIGPAEFIPVAEQTGQIRAIGEFVLDTACRQLLDCQRRVPHAAELVVSVNISPRDLVRPGFADDVWATLNRHGLSGNRLKLEITEGTTLDSEAAGDALRSLQEHGIRVSIDDFGTGYSSLGYFRHLPINGLKIDRAFVDGLGLEREDTAIVTAAIAFGQALDVEVIGEGIETELQLTRLRELGCRLGQGFLFSRPVPGSDLVAQIERGRRTSAA
jgi:diguanylate cyclase (GGDEF)-like protein/PAS domain S-box-containing protein